MKSSLLVFALAVVLSSTAAFAGSTPEGFSAAQRELDFKGLSPSTFSADASKTDFEAGPGTGWCKFFGGIEVLPGSRIHFREAGLFSSQEAVFPAHIERSSDGTIQQIVVPAQAFRFWNKPDRIYDALECSADGRGGLECHQTSFIRSGTFGF